MGGLTTAGFQFGSWTDAVRAAGLTPYESGGCSVSTKISDDELLADLLRVKAELGRDPSERTYAFRGKFSLKPIKARWGSLADALRRAEDSLSG